jgi:hypothetical protein
MTTTDTIQPEIHLCKDCVHCAARIEHGLHTKAEIYWSSAVCMKTGTFSFVTGGKVNTELCETRRQRLGTRTCPDFQLE